MKPTGTVVAKHPAEMIHFGSALGGRVLSQSHPTIPARATTFPLERPVLQCKIHIMTNRGSRSDLGTSLQSRQRVSVKLIDSVFIAVLAWFFSTVGTCTAGSVIAWGDNQYSQTNVPSGLTDASALAGGSHHSLAIDSTGKVVGWGDSSHGETTAPSSLSNVAAIAAGNGLSLASSAPSR